MMNPQQSRIAQGVNRYLLAQPRAILIGLGLMVLFLAIQARHFALDASSETMMLRNDRDLQYYRQLSRRYGSSDFLALTYTPKADIFSQETIEHLQTLKEDLLQVDQVERIQTILDVPLLESPPVPFKELSKNLRYLTTPNLDLNLAKQELAQSPLYQNLLISADLQTTALIIYFQENQGYDELRQRRNDLLNKELINQLSPDEKAELKQVSETFKARHRQAREDRHHVIAEIRAVVDQHRDHAELFLGGVSMITNDMIGYIKSDLRIFGVGVTLFIILTLGIIFRALRWVAFALLCCFVSVLCMIGLLGWFGWEVTVISSNFISLQLILTMAVAIHLMVRYRELIKSHPEKDNRSLVCETICLKLSPCLFAALTTIAGFASLLLCDILPVTTFGWMMIAGLIVSLIITFLLFSTIQVLLHKPILPNSKPHHDLWINTCAKFTERYGKGILIISALGFVFSLLGIAQLEVENSFIDYFKPSTEIYQGMTVIDQKLGGTTPLDIILNFDPVEIPENEPNTVETTVTETVGGGDEDEFDDFDDFGDFDDLEEEFAVADDDPTKYWFTPEKMELVRGIHKYLDELDETGKVLSLATTLDTAQRLNEGKPLDGLAMALLFNEAPENLQRILITPYVSVEENQTRFSVRIQDSSKTLRRNKLLKKIRHDLQETFQLPEDRFHMAGMMILYNNMLQSLFDSQIKTLGITLMALMAMFMLLFRSMKIALIALFPNALSIGIVLGFMGWAGIPLDMMTITIAAISIGIAVDDTIHYIHRFETEFGKDHNYLTTMHRCHHSIGHAMTYTSITIIMGFSILCFSNFIPSIYFGLLTSLAMLIALITALTLLPQLIIIAKPFGPDQPAPSTVEMNA